MKWMIRAAVVLVLVASTGMVADALVLSDTERLDGFADDLTGTSTTSSILERCDTERADVEVWVNGNRQTFGEGDSANLSDALHGALDSEIESEIQRSISIDGERATLAFRGESDAGPVDLEFRMERRGDGWLLDRVRIRQ